MSSISGLSAAPADRLEAVSAASVGGPGLLPLASGLDLWLVDLVAGADALNVVAARFGLEPPLHHNPGALPFQGRRRSAHIALRALLAGYVGLDRARAPFALTRSGKPSLACSPVAPGTRLEFSLAHIETTALVAISRSGFVGVDIEAPRPVRISDHRRAMLLDAAARLAADDPLPDGPGEARFLQAWVRLEALAKATGEGLGALLGRLEDKASPIEQSRLSGALILVRNVRLDHPAGHYAAVAGTCPALAATAPAPRPRWLPLEQSWLEAWVVGGAGRPD